MATNKFNVIGDVKNIEFIEVSSDPVAATNKSFIYSKTNQRLYKIDGDGTLHDLSIQHRQAWKFGVYKALSTSYQDPILYDISSASYVDITRLHSVGSADVGCVSAVSDTQVLDIDWANASVTDNYTELTYAMAVDAGGAQLWTKATNTIFTSAVPNYGTTKILKARMKIDDSGITDFTDANWTVNLVLQQKDTIGAGKYVTQSCSLTTSWADYTLTSTGDTMASPLVWSVWIQAGGVGAKPAGPDDESIIFCLDYIELTQWAI
jgi:hypothetical protein